MDRFVAGVAGWLALGPTEAISIEPMLGSANRLWRFEVGKQVIVVKELSHDAHSDLDRRRRAAAFERGVFDAGAVLMAEPLTGVDGETVAILTGSRGDRIPIRAHRWLEGTSPDRAASLDLGAVGASLHVIQEAGLAWSSEATASLRWWDEQPLTVAERLRSSPYAELGERALEIAPDALALVHDAELTAGPWVYSHLDHKPENALQVGSRTAILDWDECGHCHRRLEAVESALRWSQIGDDRPASFRAYLEGYSNAGGMVSALRPSDFGKWVAALLGWFSFQGRRALGDWSTDAPPERAQAAVMAAESVQALRSTLEGLAAWVHWY